MDQTEKLTEYISAQLQQGQSPDVIMQQLRQAGWPEEAVQRGFVNVQARVVPASMQQQTVQSAQQAAQPQSQPRANGKRRGSIKTGWRILVHATGLLNHHRYLLRYFVMTWALVVGVNAAWVGLFWFLFPDFLKADSHWYPLLFVGYLIIYCVINFYAAALSRNILDIYKGERQEYKHYIQMARSRFWPILVYSLIEAIIGVLLRYVIERLGKLGEFISWFIGSALSLITMFVLPIIMDTPSGAISAIGQSWNLLKKNWGVGIAAKIGPGAVIGLLQILLAFIFYPIILSSIYSFNLAVLLTALFVYLFISISLAILGSFASNVLSVALYYYAVNHQVPPGFTSEMLDQVFVKSRRQSKKETKLRAS